MSSLLFQKSAQKFEDHPKFSGVKIALLVTSKESNQASVCLLDISPETTIPVHTHDPQVDSIYVVSGQGKAYVNGEWKEITAGDYIFVPAYSEHGIQTGDQSLQLFVHHSPPLM